MDPDAPFAPDYDALDDGAFDLNYNTPRLSFLSSPGSRSGSPVATTRRKLAPGLPLLQLSDWDPRTVNEPSPTCVHYSVEWKLQLRKGRLSTLTEITEENLTLAPGAYWDKFLKQALTTRVQDRLPEPRYEPDETKITVSVEKRNERDLRKRFDGTNVEWKVVEDKLRAWSHLFRDGKRLRTVICFIYKETNQPVAARTRSSTKTGASRRQLAARDELLAEQEAASGMRPVWKEVYELLRCNGAFCTNKGFYCWRDPSTQKHYKLETTLLEKLVDFAEEGSTLRTNEHVPEDIRQLLREQEELQSERRRRKRKNADDHPAVNIHLCCRGHDQDSDSGTHREAQHEVTQGAVAKRRLDDLVIPKPRDEALVRYCQWHCDQVKSPSWKQGFVHAYRVTKEACLDLKHVYETQDVDFYTEKGVKLGIAKSFVGDVYLWAKKS
ncbi:hypothetical protein QBC34DRAFT_411309 [Podospora aff. communis PSN243]|uniref:Uncharacterized protein n=1 Tax=Podospora aff. communis PSN243 TaxID=3040156 RepID=A0AAV9GEW3_9PEZI|nr:hypothetical protein QBC34DRAFT_411309 [Podospora aff. communis PSN243]